MVCLVGSWPHIRNMLLLYGRYYYTRKSTFLWKWSSSGHHGRGRRSRHSTLLTQPDQPQHQFIQCDKRTTSTTTTTDIAEFPPLSSTDAGTMMIRRLVAAHPSRLAEPYWLKSRAFSTISSSMIHRRSTKVVPRRGQRPRCGTAPPGGSSCVDGGSMIRFYSTVAAAQLHNQIPCCCSLAVLSSKKTNDCYKYKYTNVEPYLNTCLRLRHSTPSSTTSKAFSSMTTTNARQTALSKQLLFRYLDLETFTQEELEFVFDRIRRHASNNNNNNNQRHHNLNDDTKASSEAGPIVERITSQDIQAFFSERLVDLEQEGNYSVINKTKTLTTTDVEDTRRHEFCVTESQRIWQTLVLENDYDDKKVSMKNNNNRDEQDFVLSSSSSAASSPSPSAPTYLTKDDFVRRVRAMATVVDVRRGWPIAASMVLVGVSVGVVTPAMPFVVEQLSLTASEYGMIVSAFAFSKMASNIPSAIVIERHGRQPYMVYSLALIALGVGGIGWASSFHELFLCRLVAGVGVSLLSGAGTLMVTDLSTPLNRASTMAPIMSGFAAGTALGPALGGIMVDSLGLNPTFYAVGLSFLGVAALNHIILDETQRRPLQFPWQQKQRQQAKHCCPPRQRHKETIQQPTRTRTITT